MGWLNLGLLMGHSFTTDLPKVPSGKVMMAAEAIIVS
jgi:hypothetical protein